MAQDINYGELFRDIANDPYLAAGLQSPIPKIVFTVGTDEISVKAEIMNDETPMYTFKETVIIKDPNPSSEEERKEAFNMILESIFKRIFVAGLLKLANAKNK